MRRTFFAALGLRLWVAVVVPGDDLRDLTAEEADLVARHPLPDGVPDGLVNKADLGLALGKSDNTVSAWIKRGLPFEQEGTNGRPYLFRLSVAFAWVEAQRAADQTLRSRSQEIAGQMALALSGGTVAPGGGLTIAEEKDLMDLVTRRNRAAREQGELIPRDDVVDKFERAFATIRDALDALPDRLGRELNLEGADLEKIERAADDALARAADLVAEVADHD